MRNLALLTAVLLLWDQQIVPAASIYRLIGSTNFDGNHLLYDLNQETGVASHERKIGFDHSLSIIAGIAYDSRLNQAYALSTLPWSRLLQFDPLTGAVSRDLRTGMPSVYEGDLAIHPMTGQLYGIQNASSQGPQVFTLNADTGIATIIGSAAAGGDYSALAFDLLGNLFAIDTSGVTNSRLEVIDPVSGISLSAIELSIDLGSTAALAFHPLTGTAFVADGASDGDGTNSLYQLDVETGVLTLIGKTGISVGLSGLMFVNVPEPIGRVAFLFFATALACRRDIGRRFMPSIQC
jgi:hypothetical protein